MSEIKIKKRRTCNIRQRGNDEGNEEGSDQSEEDVSVQSAIEEAKELRRMRKRPNGVSIEDLATLKTKPKESSSKADPLKLKTGGFVDVKTLKREISAAEEIEQIGTSFASETNRCDVDLPMLTYIEEEIAKKKGIKSDQEAVIEKPRNPEDALYELPEHIKVLTVRKKTEDMMSNTMLSGIPEVDLGIDAKIRNIEATEEAKQRLMQERLKRRDQVSAFVPTNVAVNFVQHNRYNIEDHQPQARKVMPTPKPTPLRVGDANRPPTLGGEFDRPRSTAPPGGTGSGPTEKATDDFHFEKFKKFNRRF
jgi:hypothetical protein